MNDSLLIVALLGCSFCGGMGLVAGYAMGRKTKRLHLARLRADRDEAVTALREALAGQGQLQELIEESGLVRAEGIDGTVQLCRPGHVPTF